MPDFSYESDIAPYASSYFKSVQANPFLKSARRADLSEQLVQTVEKAKEQADKNDMVSIDKELARTRLSAGQLALEEARQEAQLKRDALAKAPALNNEFEKILDADLSRGEKTAAIGRFAMQNADVFERSPSLAAKYRFALRSIEPDERASFTPYQQASLERSYASDEYRVSRDQKEDKEKEDKRIRDEQKAEREALDKSFNVEFAPDDIDLTTGKPAAPKFKTPLHRENLLDVIMKYSPDELDSASELSDADLFKKASNLRRKLISSSSQAPAAPAAKPYSFK